MSAWASQNSASSCGAGWIDWQPRADYIGDCSTQTFGLEVGRDPLVMTYSQDFTRCETYDITKWNPDVRFRSEWRGGGPIRSVTLSPASIDGSIRPTTVGFVVRHARYVPSTYPHSMGCPQFGQPSASSARFVSVPDTR
jgi:hypothetical protein